MSKSITNFSNKGKLWLKLMIRISKDLVCLHIFKMHYKFLPSEKWPGPVWTLVQPIKKTGLSEQKVHNLSTAAKRINGLTLKPGQIFSFWNLVKKPDETFGYVKGRVIRNGELSEETGGGLCQLSGMFYIFALETSMKIKERHAHSVDIYKERERFTPLGSDAAVVYAYKDFRFQNTSSYTLVFSLDVKASKVLLQARADTKIMLYKIRYKKEERNGRVFVRTLRQNGQWRQIAESVYRKNES